MAAYIWWNIAWAPLDLVTAAVEKAQQVVNRN